MVSSCFVALREVLVPVRTSVRNGQHDWRFNESGKVVRLAITIEVMKVLSDAKLDGVMRWLSSPPYPWCSPSQALLSFPAAGSVTFAVEPRLAERVDVPTLKLRWSWADVR